MSEFSKMHKIIVSLCSIPTTKGFVKYDMYRMNANNYGTPRDRLDPSILERMMQQNCAVPTMEHQEAPSCPYEPENETITNGVSLAMVYSPEQFWQNLYNEEEGFMQGTIFKELDKPFYGPKCQGGRRNG